MVNLLTIFLRPPFVIFATLLIIRSNTRGQFIYILYPVIINFIVAYTLPAS